MANRPVDLENAAAKAKYDAWIAGVDARIRDPKTDRNELCIELCRAFYGVPETPRNIHEEVALLNFVRGTRPWRPSTTASSSSRNGRR